VSSFQSSFGPHYRVGQNLTYFLTKKHIFVLFNLLFGCWQVSDLLFDLFYLWARGCSFWLLSLRQKSRYTVKKCPKLAWKLVSIFLKWFSNLFSVWDENNKGFWQLIRSRCSNKVAKLPHILLTKTVQTKHPQLSGTDKLARFFWLC